jgi:hypothetical protein
MTYRERKKTKKGEEGKKKERDAQAIITTLWHLHEGYE